MSLDAYFTQITDIHVGSSGWNREQARENLRSALDEMARGPQTPEVVLVTADLVNRGTREELAEYVETVKGSDLPMAALPANHDLWGEKDSSAWLELIGPMHSHVDCGERRYILLDVHHRGENGSWWAGLDGEQRAWLETLLAEWSPRPIFVAMHPPILPRGDDWHDVWHGSNARETLELLAEYEVQALITGHWHRNGEWNVLGVRQITTGALTGWQWNATPPYYHFPTRPGYRWFHFDGETVRTFWRELKPSVQMTFTWAGKAHVGGPRPQVRPPIIGGPCVLQGETWSLDDPVVSVEWSVSRGDWRPMTCSWQGLWSEWSAPLEPKDHRVGETTLVLRATTASGQSAYDAVPARIDQGHPDNDVRSGQETVFELFYLPE